MMRGATYANARIGYNIDIFIRALDEAMPWIGAQIEFMISIRDFECLRQLARPRTKSADVLNTAPCSHELNPADRLQRPNQDKPIRFAFYEHVQHPVRAIAKVNVSRAGLVSLNE
jgi:hypothetical protein